MAKRNSPKTNDSGNAEKPQVSSISTADSVEQRVIAFAEQVGRLAGTVQAKSEGWFDRQALSDQIANIRDSAAEMVEHLAAKVEQGSTKPTGATARSSGGRSGGVVDAPGKKHRKPMPSTAGAKHSDTRIAKVKIANESRRRGGER